jgi:hypothetical protein
VTRHQQQQQKFTIYEKEETQRFRFQFPFGPFSISTSSSSLCSVYRISKTATKPAFSRQQHKTKDKTKNYKKEPKETTRMPMANHG